MPAYAIREWRQEEKPKALPEQIAETIDSCEDVAKTAKSRLKKFLAEMGIQDILEMDYLLRKTFCSLYVRSNRLTVISLRMTGQNRQISADG